MKLESPKKSRKIKKSRKVLTVVAAVVVLLAGYTTYTIARPFVLHTEIDIDASPEQVWKVLTDRQAYPADPGGEVPRGGDPIHPVDAEQHHQAAVRRHEPRPRRPSYRVLSRKPQRQPMQCMHQKRHKDALDG